MSDVFLRSIKTKVKLFLSIIITANTTSNTMGFYMILCMNEIMSSYLFQSYNIKINLRFAKQLCLRSRISAETSQGHSKTI